jgi:hypothetical protein
MKVCVISESLFWGAGSQYSSVGKATHYGLNGPEIESVWGRFFAPVQTGSRGPPSLVYNGY